MVEIHVRLWTWLSWRGQSKLPNERPLEYCVLWQFRFHFKFHVSRSGVRIPVKAIFCDVTPRATHINQSINQSIKVFKKIFSIDWPLQKVERRKKTEKIGLTEIRTPYLEKCGVWCGFYAHSVGCQVSDYSRHELHNLASVHSICHLIDWLPWLGFEPHTWKTWSLM